MAETSELVFDVLVMVCNEGIGLKMRAVKSSNVLVSRCLDAIVSNERFLSS